MFVLFTLLFSLSAHAEKIVYNLNGEQRVVEVGQGGGVTMDAEIVWRENIHGPLPANAPVGYAERWEETVVKQRDVIILDEDGKPVLDDKGRPTYKKEEYETLVPRLRERADLKAAKAAKDAAKRTLEDQEAAEATEFAALKNKIKAEIATAAEVRKAFKFLLKKLRE